jgi:hypothetical protein
MTYRDMTFCRFYHTCREGSVCPRALTDEVKKGAIRWMPTNPIISCFSLPPECYVGTMEKNRLR